MSEKTGGTQTRTVDKREGGETGGRFGVVAHVIPLLSETGKDEYGLVDRLRFSAQIGACARGNALLGAEVEPFAGD